MKISLLMCPIWNVDQPPLSVAYIAGALKSAGHEVFCHDFSIDLIYSLPNRDRDAVVQKYLASGWYTNFEYWRDKLSLDLLVSKWTDEIISNAPGLVGFSIYDSTLAVSLLLAEAIRKKSPETCIVFGGPSCDNKDIITRGPIDFLVYGEGEDTITDLVERLESNISTEDCPGIVYTKQGQVFQTKPRPRIADINAIPFPDFSGFDLDQYPSRSLPMFTSRGCPNRCSFCSESPRWGKFRYRTAENIVSEMKNDVARYGRRHFSMEDSTINGNIREFEKMCDLIISDKLRVTWGGKARIETKMSPDLIKKAYQAGCRGFVFGIESASQRVLDHMKKNVKISDIEKVIINSHQAGISVGCFFIVGYVNETEEDFEETLQFIRRNHQYIDTVYQGSGLHILKGSRLYAKAGEYGIVLPEASPDGEWCTTDGSNTATIRADRLKRFNSLVNELYNQQGSPSIKKKVFLYYKNMEKKILKKWHNSVRDIQSLSMKKTDDQSPAPSNQNKKKSETGIICHQPFYFMEITTSGDVYTCCPGWIKFPIGNIKNKTIAEIWNGNRARYIRRKLYAGEWEKICNPICPRIAVYKHDKHLITYDYLETFDYLTPQLINEIRSGKEHLESSPTVFNLSNSKICNLSCIMCGRHSQDDDPKVIEKTAKDVFQHLPNARQLVLSGMGDPFARPDTRALLTNFDGRNYDLRINLITNGLLLPKYWEQVKHQKFGTLLISVDAARKETYDKIRIGGSWGDLLQCLNLVKDNRDKFSSVTINMTVMRRNYREIPEFIDFAESYGFDASFQRIRGDHGEQNFFEKPDYPALNELGEIIVDEQLKNRRIKVVFGDLLECTFMGFKGYDQNGEMNEYKSGPGPCVIYDEPPGDIATPAEVNFGNKVKLAGITVDKLSPQQVMVAYDWQILDAPGKFRKVFVHFMDSEETILFQNDHDLCYGKSLESAKGKSIKEIYVLDIPEAAVGREINIKIGVYVPEPDYPRLTVESSGGMRTADNNTCVIFEKIDLSDTNQ